MEGRDGGISVNLGVVSGSTETSRCPPDICIWIGSNPPLRNKKETHPQGVCFFFEISDQF